MPCARSAYWPVLIKRNPIGSSGACAGFGREWVGRSRSRQRCFETVAHGGKYFRVREDEVAVGTHGIERHLRHLRSADLARADSFFRVGTCDFLRLGGPAVIAQFKRAVAFRLSDSGG